MRDIGKNIRALRMRKHMTQDELAEKLFVTRQTVSNYETGRSRPDVEMMLAIAEALDTDANAVLYGPPVPEGRKRQVRQLCIGAAVTLALGLLLALLWKPAMSLFQNKYIMGPRLLIETYLLPLLFVILGWTVMCGIGLLLKAKPLDNRWAKYGRWTVFGVLVLVFALMLPHGMWFLRDWLLDIYVDGLDIVNGRYSGFTVRPDWINRVVGNLWAVIHKHQSVFLLFGVMLWVFGCPKRKETGKREKLWLCAAAGLSLGIVLYAAAEREYVLTLEPGTQAENIPFNVEIQWQEEVIIG